ncbi:hypothetical protein BJX61DRAFT_534543 [Aspergillus egyptiacus]|nr:hypothetical protein BJX61DRAFT_534543 [Aspergillus egyptiacus]
MSHLGSTGHGEVKDIHFFDNPDPSTDQPQPVLAYMTSSVSRESQPASSAYHRLIRNPVLFGLGLMFLELAFQAPLAALEQSIDLQERGTAEVVGYFTASRLVVFRHGRISKSFQEATKRCLYCNIGHDNDFQITDNLEERFRELQLD